MFLKVEKLKELLPLGGAFIICLGFLKLSIYYNAFGIQINNYLEFSEYLTSFFDDSILYISMMLLVYLLDFSTKQQDEIRQKWHESMFVEEKLHRRILLFMKRIALIISIINLGLIVFWLITLFRHSTFPIITLTIWFFFNLMFLIIFLVLEIRRKYFIVYNKRMEITFSNLLVIIPMIVLLVISISSIKVNSVKMNKLYFGTKIIVDSTEIVSDSLHYYIGHTNRFLFFFHQDSNRTMIIPMSRVKQITLKTK